jgi:undecaprenyl-phosphate 4-deoxy-4-formamido-L-arabinose transferase
VSASAIDVSVVVPVLDEERTVVELVERTRDTLEARRLAFEMILVDDGSRDGTVPLLRGLEAEDARLRVFELTRNFGQAAALACGLFAARGGVVVTIDADLQNPPEEIPRLLDAVDKGAFVVTARRLQRYERTWRWAGSRMIHALARLLTGASIRDFGGQFKAYRREVVECLRGVWAPGKPIFPLALWLGFPVAEVDVRHEPRAAGTSRYSLSALIRINLDLVTSFTTVPLVLLGAVGLGALVLGALGMLLSFWLEPVGWFAPAAALVVFAIGGVWAAAGVLGVYLARVYKQVSGTAAFVVRSGPSRDGSAPGPGIGKMP